MRGKMRPRPVQQHAYTRVVCDGSGWEDTSNSPWSVPEHTVTKPFQFGLQHETQHCITVYFALNKKHRFYFDLKLGPGTRCYNILFNFVCFRKHNITLHFILLLTKSTDCILMLSSVPEHPVTITFSILFASGDTRHITLLSISTSDSLLPHLILR